MRSSNQQSHPRRRLLALLGLGLAAVIAFASDLSASGIALGSAAKQNKVGTVTDILEDTVLLRGKLLTHGNVPLYAGNKFNTKGGGSVVFTLKQRHTTCTLYSGSVLTVKPKKLVNLFAGGVDRKLTDLVAPARIASAAAKGLRRAAGTNAWFGASNVARFGG